MICDTDFASHFLDIVNGRVLSDENIIELWEELGVHVKNINELDEKVYPNVENIKNNQWLFKWTITIIKESRNLLYY